MTKISYAQNFEDIVLGRAFAGRTDGFWVDVGAGHPVLDSVTKALSDLGWNGINIEPLSEECELLRAARPRDVTLEAAISTHPGRRRFFAGPAESRGSSTLDARLAARYRKAGFDFAEREIEVTTLDEVFAQYVKTTVDFLKIDVEGHERQVLQSLDLARWRPRVIIIEATYPNSQVTMFTQWEDLFAEADYVPVLFDGLNRFYVRAEDNDLVEPLSYPACVFDDFMPFRWFGEISSLRQQLNGRPGAVATAESVLPEPVGEPAVVGAVDALVRELRSREAEVASLRSALAQRSSSAKRSEAHLRSSRERLEQKRHEEVLFHAAASARLEGELAESTRRVASLEATLAGLLPAPSEAPSGATAPQTPPALCTIVSKNYLAHARTLVDSYLEHCPGGRAFVLLVDRVDDHFDPAAERFTLVQVEDLDVPGFRSFSFRYTLLELNTAVKPFFLQHLFRAYDLDKLCYFDPDILITSELTELSRLLDEHGIVLTPHLLDFLEDGRYPDELNILLAGTFNLGFIGLSRHEELDRFLEWWQRKLLRHCSAEPGMGLFVDQRWIDMVPALFSSVHVLRDPGYNVAYWNLAHRPLDREEGSTTAAGRPLRFFHFSGFTPDNIEQVSKHQNRFALRDVPGLRPLFEDYRDRLKSNGYDEVRSWPFALAAFDDGVPIPDFARRACREADPGGITWLDPYDTSSPGSFRAWLNEPVDGVHGPIVTRLALQVFRERIDLQKAFPDVLGQHRAAYSAWFAASVREQHGFDPLFIEPMLPRDEAVEPPAEHSDHTKVPAQRNGWRSALLIGAFRVNSTVIGRAIKAVIGRSSSMRLKQALLAMSGLPAASHLAPVLPYPLGSACTTGEAGGEARAGLNVVGYLDSENGIGEVARGTLRAARAAGVPVAGTPVALNDHARKSDGSWQDVRRGHPHPVTLLHVNADQVPAVADALGEGFFAEKYTIGYWFWETDSFPEEWLDRFERFDEIWVASSFTRDVLKRISPVPVVRVSPCVELGAASPPDRARFGLPADRVAFLFTFDPFSIDARKNPFGVIEAFRRSFGQRSREAVLVIKANNLARIGGLEAQLGVDEGYANRLASAVDSVSGVLIDRYLDREELAVLFSSSDAFVSLHRSEGFGLTMAEAMLMGKPCVATGYSSNLDFMTRENSFLVDHRLVELDRDFGPYRKGTRWAEPDLDHAAALMRRIVEHPDEALVRAERGREDLPAVFGRGPVGGVIAARLRVIAGLPAREAAAQRGRSLEGATASGVFLA